MIKLNFTPHGFKSINGLIKHPKNEEIYGNVSKRKEYIGTLTDDILEKGLYEPIQIYEGTEEMDSGHHRLAVFEGVGEKEIPYVEVLKPKDELEQAESITSKNMRPVFTTVDKYYQVNKMRELKIKRDGDDNIEVYTRKTCTKLNTTYKTWTMLRELILNNRKDLFDRVASDENALSVKVAHTLMQKDLNPPGKNLSASIALQDFIKKNDIKTTMISTMDSINKHLHVESVIGTETYKFTLDYSEGFLSWLLHDTFSFTLAKVLKQRGFAAKATNNNGIYDLTIPKLCWDPEVKTAMWKNGTNVKWTGKQKSGYHFFISRDPQFKRFYVAYVYVPHSVWERSRNICTIDLKTLYELPNVKTFLGSIEKNTKGGKEKFSLHLDKIETII